MEHNDVEGTDLVEDAVGERNASDVDGANIADDNDLVTPKAPFLYESSLVLIVGASLQHVNHTKDQK
ncbi:unnamed protein product [Onchocerca flexuosa]|uniref:Retrovirus-related Pol polyprotein from transposon TNT 1-94 n=1 Tax=Onchocerca flexuosa TaxID=387005 RepID=A0A183I862_9BILA|nr:unnamed protein product [Onchocerca flexuosa]